VTRGKESIRSCVLVVHWGDPCRRCWLLLLQYNPSTLCFGCALGVHWCSLARRPVSGLVGACFVCGSCAQRIQRLYGGALVPCVCVSLSELMPVLRSTAPSPPPPPAPPPAPPAAAALVQALSCHCHRELECNFQSNLKCLALLRIVHMPRHDEQSKD
jgi:hypothetical protein